MRAKAIAQFTAFIERYPDEPRFTPDTLFRLAELRFEETKDEQVLARRRWQDQVKQLGPGEEPPPEPRLGFDKSIALYQTLVSRFPGYAQIDGVHYLLGYVLDQQGEPEQAQRMFATMIEKYPKSKLIAEAYMRIGEYWFDLDTKTDAESAAALGKAASAYSHVLDHPEHKLYDKALYKLGWTNFRFDKYREAVDAFVKLVDYYDARKDSAEESAGELRGEALQYAAVSFADEQWGGLDKAVAYFKSIGARPWESEFFRKLADIYFEQRKNQVAADTYRVVLAKKPLAPDAPELQQRIVQADERDREFEKAWQDRDVLIKMLTDGAPWLEANKNSPGVLKKTREVVQQSLLASAGFHHRQAQAYKQADKLAAALQEFRKAAEAYDALLQRFPRAKSNKETRFYFAETLYNSLQFGRAAGEYVKVRDDQSDGNYLAESAYAAVLSVQHAIEDEEQKGTLPAAPLWKAAERPKDKPVQKRELPALWARSVAAANVFLKLFPKDEKYPELAYKAAEAFYRYDDFAEARKRFEALIAAWPDAKVSQYASNYTLESYLAEGDWKQVEQFSGKRLADKKSGLSKQEVAELSKLKQGARFQRGVQLMDGKKYSEAAALFLVAVDEDPKVEFADKALNNAAFCKQQELKYESALGIYERLFRDYPKSPLADTALFLVGFSAEKAFDFDKSISVYANLVDNYPQSPKRADALFNEAHALERLQRYPEAQRAYARYAELFPEREDAPAMLFQAAAVAEHTKDWDAEIRDLAAFVRKFDKTPKQGERIVQAYLKIGKAFKQLSKETAAKSAFENAVLQFDTRKLTPQDLIGAASAAEARFQLAEAEFARYETLRIEARGRGTAFEKSLKAALTKKAEEREKVLALYKAVAVKYQRPDWIVAALYRVGYVDERFSAALTEAPIPPELRKLGEEYVAQYQDALSQLSIPIDQRAMEAYEKAIQSARELRIANEWTRRILESLDKYDHRKWPLLKDAKQEMLFEPLSPLQLAGMDGLKKAADRKIGEDDK